MSTTRARAALLALAIPAALVLGAAPSYADHGGVLVSETRTGGFHDHLDVPLFESEVLVVPERRSTSTFYVKNDAETMAHLTLATQRRGRHNDLSRALGLSFEAGDAASTSALEVGRGSTCPTTRVIVPPGEVVPVRVHLDVTGLHAQVGMGQSAQLDVVVNLTEVPEDDPRAVCGLQENAGSGPGDCQLAGTVITVVGAPTCVPTTVDAGAAYGEGAGRDPIPMSGIALLLGFVGWLTGWNVCRREDEPAA